TAAGVRELAALDKLTSLTFGSHGNQADGAGKELSAMKGLVTLRLGGEGLTDEGVRGLVGLENLTTLDLSHTVVTGAGCKNLATLVKLTTLKLSGCIKLTEEGVKR